MALIHFGNHSQCRIAKIVGISDILVAQYACKIVKILVPKELTNVSERPLLHLELVVILKTYILWTVVEEHGKVLINDLGQKILIFPHGTKTNYFKGW